MKQMRPTCAGSEKQKSGTTQNSYMRWFHTLRTPTRSIHSAGGVLTELQDFFFLQSCKILKTLPPQPQDAVWFSEQRGNIGRCVRGSYTDTPLMLHGNGPLLRNTSTMVPAWREPQEAERYWEFVPANQRRTFSDFGRSLTRSLLANWPKCNWLHKEIRIIPFCAWGQFESSLASSKEQLSQYFLNQNLLKSHTFCLEYSVPKYTLTHTYVYTCEHIPSTPTPTHSHPSGAILTRLSKLDASSLSCCSL